jgi:hypothetical protein
MMTFDNLNADAAGKPPADVGTDPIAGAQPPTDPNVIVAVLPHPTTMGTPLSRGARYLHHFEVELISDGKRLWHVLSDEGRKVVDTIEGERRADKEAQEAARAAHQQSTQADIATQQQKERDEIAANRKAQEEAVAKANAEAADAAKAAAAAAGQ